MLITKIPIIKITKLNGNVIEINPQSSVGISSGTLKLKSAITSNSFSLGDMISSEFSVQLFNINENLEGCEIQLLLEENGVRTSKFKGIIDSSKKDNTDIYRDVIAYDWFYYHREDDISNWWNNFWASSRTSATLKQIRQSLITYIGFTNDTKTYINDSIVIPNNFNLYTDLKLNTILKMVCELQAITPHIDENGNLEFIKFSTSNSPKSISYEGANSKWEDYTTEQITGVGIYATSNDLSQLIGTNTNVYNIVGNLFALTLNATTLNTLGTNVLNAIKDITYTPAKIKMITSDFSLKLGDLVVNDNNDYSYVMSNTLSGVCLVEQTIESFANGSKLSQEISSRNDNLITGAKFSKLEQDIDGIRTEVSATYVTKTDYNTKVQNLQEQIDGAIETFTGSVVPTLNNYPANQWNTTTLKDKHIGDLYMVNSSGGDYAGFYYRFEKNNNTYQWTLLKDNEVAKALAEAEQANQKAAQAQSDLADLQSDLTTNYSTTTQMQSAINQKANEITSTVSATYTTKQEFNNLEIGGRNLLPRFSNFNDGIVMACTYEYDDSTGTYVLKSTSSSAGTFKQIYVIDAVSNPTEYAGKMLMFSAKTITSSRTAANPKVYIYVTKTDNTVWASPPLDKSALQRTITIPSDTKYIGYIIRIDQNKAEQVGETATFVGIKLEVGNKATDWTPAPEDIESEISTVQSSITQLADQIVLKVDNNGNVVKIALDGSGTSSNVLIKGDNIQLDGDVTITSGFVLNVGTIQSQNYVANTSGMKIDLSNGNFDSKYFKINSNGVSVSGDFTAYETIRLTSAYLDYSAWDFIQYIPYEHDEYGPIPDSWHILFNTHDGETFMRYHAQYGATFYGTSKNASRWNNIVYDMSTANTTDTLIPVLSSGKFQHTERAIWKTRIHSNYNINQDYLATISCLTWWNGAYNANGGSNLTYCNKGAFGTIVTKNVGDYVSTGTVSGQFYAISNFQKYASSNNANATANGTNYLIPLTTSDKNLKKNIEDTKINALEVIGNLRHKQFDYKYEDLGKDTIKIGYIAQELEEVIPESVIDIPQNEETSLGGLEVIKQIDYNAIVPYLTKAIQELTNIVEEQQKVIDKLS